MAQWVNCLQNNIFINPPPLPSLCDISEALYLVQPGLMTGGREADKMQVNFEIFKVGCWWCSNISGACHKLENDSMKLLSNKADAFCFALILLVSSKTLVKSSFSTPNFYLGS